MLAASATSSEIRISSGRKPDTAIRLGRISQEEWDGVSR
jgi:hypothetical protein